MRSKPISPNIRHNDNKITDDDHLKKKDKVKLIEKQMESKPIDPILEAIKKKFESNKWIENQEKEIFDENKNEILMETILVQVVTQTKYKKI